MSGFDFATAAYSFSRGARTVTDGAFWALLGIRAGLLGLPSTPSHRLGYDFEHTDVSLGKALGAYELRRLEMGVAQQGWARSPIAMREWVKTPDQEPT